MNRMGINDTPNSSRQGPLSGKSVLPNMSPSGESTKGFLVSKIGPKHLEALSWLSDALSGQSKP